MRIFAKKKFAFSFGGEYFETSRVLDFVDAPDWIVKDPIFALAKKEGSIEVLDATANKAAAKPKAATASKAAAKPKAATASKAAATTDKPDTPNQEGNDRQGTDNN